ncbi:MAG TPA: transglutaminase domain-containing protein [Chitinophagaceae bacterium]|nr:transglutaminase domain-containing protein [Chitinophagaceae bacterium]
MISSKLRWLCLAGAVFFCLPAAYTQVQNDYSNAIPSLKSKYPKTDVVAVAFTEEFSFGIQSKGPEEKVTANTSTTQLLVSLKDFTSKEDAIFYDDESSIENVKFISKGKSIKLPMQCMDYQSEGIFHSDAKICVMKIPLETKGIPVSYSYEKKYKDVKYLTSVYFHEGVPIEEKTLVFNIPDWLEVEFREFNFAGYDIKKEVQKDASANTTRYIYKLKNIPEFEREYRSPHMAKTYPHIILVSKSYIANGQRKVLFESVKDLYAWYRSVTSQTNNNPEELKPVVQQLTQNKKTDIEKIESMFYWVQEKIRYIAFENGIMGFRPDAAQNVLKKKYGDCKGKANLLAQMLKLAGYDARLTWIGTSDLPYDYSLPSLGVDNHMICTVILDGKRYFLDGTEEHIALNDYAHRIQGKQVLIEDGSNYIIDKIPEFPAERNKVQTTIKLKLENDILTGTTTSIFNGESKINVVGVYESMRNDNKQDALQQFLKGGDNNVTIKSLKEPNWADRQKPLQLEYEIAAKNQVTKAGNELYIVLDRDKELSTLEFDSTRRSDYEMRHKYYFVSTTEFTIPDGYKVDYTPDAVNVKTKDYSFEGAFAVKGNTLVYTKKMIVNKTNIRKSEFNEWNNFIRSVNKFYNDQVVLVKK